LNYIAASYIDFTMWMSHMIMMYLIGIFANGEFDP